MKSRFLLGIVLVLALVTVAMAADDPFVGTWKLNLAKSKFSPGPAPKSATVKCEVQGNVLNSVTDRVDSEGKATHTESTSIFDGKDHPATGNQTVDSYVSKRIGANTIERVGKKGGKEVESGRNVVSKDGKTRTLAFKGKNAQGQDVNNIAVYDKQ